MIICNKEKLKNPNTLVLGVPGSGKSFLVKHEIEATMASSDDDIIICDPEGEYDVIMNHFGGEVIEIYAGGKDHINAMRYLMKKTNIRYSRIFLLIWRSKGESLKQSKILTMMIKCV